MLNINLHLLGLTQFYFIIKCFFTFSLSLIFTAYIDNVPFHIETSWSHYMVVLAKFQHYKKYTIQYTVYTLYFLIKYFITADVIPRTEPSDKMTLRQYYDVKVLQTRAYSTIKIYVN